MTVADFFAYLLRRQDTEDLGRELASVYQLHQLRALVSSSSGA